MAPKEEKATAYVFIADREYGWRPAVLEDTRGTTAHVSIFTYKDEAAMACDGGRAATKKKGDQVMIDLRDYPHQVLPLQNADTNGNLIEFADMVKLPYLHEAAILYNLKARHYNGKPYTRTGDIVIAVNPFQWFTDLYTEKKRNYYSNRLVWEPSEQDPRDGMEPHVYECSALAYKGLAFGHADQSILVSGESGAGKTETVKICMNHIASVQQGPKRGGSSDVITELDPVVQKVVESNPLLEAFGNASTRRNDNSSRFGKYLQLQFDTAKNKGSDFGGTSANCGLAGSKCEVYLLEKNRVTGHDSEERTYHVFYQLLAAADGDRTQYWDKLRGCGYDSFKYIGKPRINKIEGQSDAEHFAHTVKTLQLVGVNGDKLRSLIRAICIVLQCGNLTFGAQGGDKDKSECTSSKEMSDLADLMGVSVEDLSLTFTERTMKTKTETYKVPLNLDFAKDACDSFAKEVYGRLFLWVVNEINAATRAEDNYKGDTTNFGIIGLLDIFGFESFVTNRFEQLCINYANEKLQQKFTEDVFRAVQMEYESEGIELAEIKYDDNTDVLDLIESRTGLLAMLNEECVRPKGNDQDFVQKALQSNTSSPCLIVNKYDRMSFGVHHYAGKVMYDADGFVSRNQDTLPTDLEDIAKKSTNEVVAAVPAPPTPAAAPNGGGRRRAMPKRQKSNIVGETIWSKYKTQLSSLMSNLRKTNSRYIRCIKPNMRKVPVVMEHVPTIEQLRCAGVVAAVTLARSAFPNRLENSAVRFRYSSLWDKNDSPTEKSLSDKPDEGMRKDCDAILTSALRCKEVINDEGKVIKAFVVGRTRSYFRAGALEYLESNRLTGLDSQAMTIQKYARGFLVRKQFSDLVNSKAEAEKERRERIAREAEEAKVKAAAEKAERDVERKVTIQKAEVEVKEKKKELVEIDQHCEEKLQEIEERRESAEVDIDDLKDKTSDEAKRALKEPKKIAAVQKRKLDEQTKMIVFLKKENTKIRKEHDKVKKKFDVVKENNEKLVRASENTGDDFDLLNDDAKRVNTKNEDLMTTLENAKKKNKKLKADCMKRQDEYMQQAETRLEYQKTMARILNMIQDAKQEPQLVEDIVVIALECESEAKSIMAELEAETE